MLIGGEPEQAFLACLLSAYFVLTGSLRSVSPLVAGEYS